MCAKLCASPLWSAPDPCDDPSKHRAKDGKHDQWDGPSHHRGDQWRRAGTLIPEQRPHSFTLQTPDGQKEQRRHKQSRQKSGDSDSLWSGHAQLIAIGQAGGSASSPSLASSPNPQSRCAAASAFESSTQSGGAVITKRSQTQSLRRPIFSF